MQTTATVHSDAQLTWICHSNTTDALPQKYRQLFDSKSRPTRPAVTFWLSDRQTDRQTDRQADTRLMASFPVNIGKPLPEIWILMKQQMMGWQWHQLDYMQIICTSLQTDNHPSISSLNFLQAGCPSWRPTNSVKALKASDFLTVSCKKNVSQHFNHDCFCRVM